MSEHNFKEPMVAYSLVFGYLAKTKGKVQRGNFNKLISEAGFDRLTQIEFTTICKQITTEDYYSSIANDTIDGKLDISELTNYYTGDKVVENNDPFSIVEPYVEHRQRSLDNQRDFNKWNRDNARLDILSKSIQGAIVDTVEGAISKKPKEIKYQNSDSELVVFLSDWHIGALISEAFKHGGYNYSILKERLETYKQEIKRNIDLYKVETAKVIFLGDMIEGANMRANQGYSIEFTLSEQIAKGTELLIEFLLDVANMGVNVDFGAIRGNHDRLTGQNNKKEELYNDSAMYVVLNTLETLSNVGQLPNVNVLTENKHDMYDITVDVMGKKVHGNHGDVLKKGVNPFDRLQHEEALDIIATGHVHNFKMQQHDYDKFHIVVGSPMGYNDYSKNLMLDLTSPSQTLMVVPREGSPVIQNVILN